jgi:hypothetical protein
MRNLAVAMVLMGGLFTVVAIAFMLGDSPSASVVGILIPSVSLIVAGGIILRRYRD